ncbi:related to MON2 Peripheral membrane protein with a role in endocytosis and vacuole integrity [Cephalotrichum gorgonifer]|uniref:Related to MON2 Peripheral membrane protein with a role in endocytosis and vacuole integrity n=1 Tax=Cephalotrichum gorgonifer TaxID=2041049 RepID=A0AAE8SXG6_9PEZI|nr:related to MON2 Peripheral membrane protein with a role in endocytosis and vacuole integrity [Cephalotrichum gorgonifer]
MTAHLLASELANLIQESKRKHNDLRQAAEKSLEELKSLKGTTEAQIAADLSQRVNFINPFIIACGTKNTKFTGISIVCLQRLIVAKALPRQKLNQVLEALREATSAGLDVQLKILQALPSLLQNYAPELRGDLLVTALNICFVLQASRNAVVNNTSAATLQQLVVSVFDKVVAEDKFGEGEPFVGEAPVSNGTVKIRTAALDAYRVFNDLCLMTENQRPEYLRFTGLPQTFGLELIESVLTNHAAIFLTHPEQAHILRTRVMPFVISALNHKANFATSVRLVRILYTLLRRHINILPSESGQALDILTRILDHDTQVWRRALCMEVFRGVFAEAALLRRIFQLYDSKEGEKDVLKTLTATFVRLSTEKPAVIGLGPQSTIPVSNPYAGAGNDVMLESGGVTGIISSSVSSEGANTGISTRWSSVRVPCIDQLDKTEPPTVPESYIYNLTLACISSLSEGLAKFVLPLTAPGERNRKKLARQDSGRSSPAPSSKEEQAESKALERTPSFKKNPFLVNPLDLEDHPLLSEVKICAAIIDECWPAILATCSTFLNAAIDSEYYHSLVRAFQKFAHVAGLLQLTTPRDAFLTTLGKAAVPPNVFTVCLNSGPLRPGTPTAGPSESVGGILSNARGLLGRDSTSTQGSQAPEKGRQGSADPTIGALNTRNLLCLRALLNLGIALGPSLGESWSIILGTLQQADFVLYSCGKTPGKIPTAVKGQDAVAENEANELVSNFGGEIRAVEVAASRLIESTVDFPNKSFVEVVQAICNLLEAGQPEPPAGADKSQSPPPTGNTLLAPAGQHRRVLSISAAAAAGPTQEDMLALAKLGDVATVNIERLLSYPPDVSGWTPLTAELIRVLNSLTMYPSVRTRAAGILVHLVLEAANVAASLGEEQRGKVQLRLLEAFRDALLPMQAEDREVSVTTHATDVEIHKIILDGLKSILENSGEALVSGWEIAFEIIGSIFIRRTFAHGDDGKASQQAVLMTRSAKLIRSSFNSLQLICSDFLTSLPNSCFLLLVDTLYEFCTQDDDLNIALTTVTFFWVLSDFLSGRNKSLSITSDVMQGRDASELEEMAADSEHAASDAALWMLLLLRLTKVTADDRLELRNSAIQTLLRIFDAYGDHLSPEAWSICIKSVLFKLLSSIEEELEEANEEDSDDKDKSEWNETAVVVLNGISTLLANYLDVLTQHPSFNALWKDLLAHFGTLLDFRIFAVNTATFNALGKILTQTQDLKSEFGEEPSECSWELWSRGIPTFKEEDEKKADNQNCLLAYVSALRDVYRLINTSLTVERVKRMLVLLREAMQQVSMGSYAADIESMTPLQAKILDAVQMVRVDIAGVPSAIVSQVSEFVALAFGQEATGWGPQKRTFVAMSKASMGILQSLILNNATDGDIYTSGAFTAALSALSRPITLKYGFRIVTKSEQPWRLATTTAHTILEATLSHAHSNEVPVAVLRSIWQEIVAIANGIVSADCNYAPQQGATISADEEFDMEAFLKLRELVIPSLGSEKIPDKTRKTFAESLFRTSIIHAPSPEETRILEGSARDALSTLLRKPRHGRTAASLPTRRPRMSYVCLNELFSLVSAYDDPSTPSINIQPPTPKFPPAVGAMREPSGALHTRIARTAAPYLILRSSLTLRAYVSDQPLRGRMPQPLSQRKELLHVLAMLTDLRSENEAIPDVEGVESENRKHLVRIYPLLVGAAGVAGASGDEGVLRALGEALSVVGGEFGI